VGTGSGICSQFMYKQETVVGTPVTVDHAYKHVTIGGNGLDVITIDDPGLGGCALVPTIDRTVKVAQQVSRDVELNVGTRNLGLIIKQMLCSTLSAPVLLSGSFYRQAHWNGDAAGRSLTVQFGMPETTATGTVRAFTINGAKITQWELAQARNDFLKLRFTLDGWDETTATALASASYVGGTGATINEALRFNCFSAKLGGTPSVASSVVSVAGGTEVAGCRGVSVKGVLPLRTDGFFSGGNGTKSEQLTAGDGFQQFTADMDIEFQSRTQIYDIFAAYTTTTAEFSWIGKVDAGSSQFGKLSVILPQCKLKGPASPMVTGPGALDNKASIMAYGDPAGTLPAIQVLYENLDVAF
jgi:Phage tail tube protein